MKIKGRVVHENLEGGFWGIRSDDGRKFLPVDGIPSRFRKAGCAIEADVEPTDAVSMMMWGHPVKLRSIKKR